MGALRRGVHFFSNGPRDVGSMGSRRMENGLVANGTIKKIVSDRGFGFISASDGKEYFFHRDSVDNFDSLRGGESVTFNVESSPKGPRASQVRVIK
jgi:CspA family cold shock protein